MTNTPRRGLSRVGDATRLTNSTTRVRAAVAAPAIIAAAALSGVVAAPQAIAEPVSQIRAAHAEGLGITRSGRPAAGFTVDAADRSTLAVDPQVAPLAVVNLGLSTAQAKNVQRWLHAYWGYTGRIDGLLGTNSWKAFQRNLKANWGYKGRIDGVVGSGTIRALQRLLKYGGWGYKGPIDGIAGSGTKAAFKRFANAHI